MTATSANADVHRMEANASARTFESILNISSLNVAAARNRDKAGCEQERTCHTAPIQPKAHLLISRSVGILPKFEPGNGAVVDFVRTVGKPHGAHRGIVPREPGVIRDARSAIG